MELSHFDSEIPMTAALDIQAIQRSSSTLSKTLFTLMSIKWTLLDLKLSHSLLLQDWSVSGSPVFKLISSKSNSSSLKNNPSFHYTSILCNSELWTLTSNIQSKVNSFQRWITWTFVLNIRWPTIVKNKKIYTKTKLEL